MKLVRSEDIRLRLGLGSVDTLVAAAENACEEATLHLERDLRSSLPQATYSDLWLVQRWDRSVDRITLKLSAGFVQDGIQIGTGYTKADAEVDTSLTATALVMPERGLVILTDEIAVLDRYISVRYTAGFPTAAAPNTQNMLDVTTAPEWLLKAAELKAVALMADSPEFDNKEGRVIDGKAYNRQYSVLVEGKVRYAPDARLPTV